MSVVGTESFLLVAGSWQLVARSSQLLGSAPPVCFNTGLMDSQAAQHLHDLLSALDPSVAAPALRPLERLVARSGSCDGLIAAIVGASGVGKSEIVNALAGARVVAAGPLRPTTTEKAIWGDVDPAYLPGKRVSDPEPLPGVALVDTPAAEHYSEAVANVLDLADVAIFVTSPERYADAITASLLATIREWGIPVFTVVSMGPQDPVDVDRLIEDAKSKLETPIDAVVVGTDMSPLKSLLDDMVLDREDLLERRDRAAASLCAIRTREVADVLHEHVIESRTVVASADEAFARARLDRRQLAATADEEWDVAAALIATMASEATDIAIDETAANVAANATFSRVVAEASVSLPSIDQGPIDVWHQSTTDLALASVKRRWMHPRRSRSVRDEMWRLSVDFDRRPSNRIRNALRGRLPDLRFDGGMALTAAIRDAGTARITAFRSDLDPSSRVSPEELRAAADAVAVTGSLPGEADDDAA